MLLLPIATVVVCIVVSIDGLRLETGDGIELLKSGRSPTGQRRKDRTLDLGDFRILNGQAL